MNSRIQLLRIRLPACGLLVSGTAADLLGSTIPGRRLFSYAVSRFSERTAWMLWPPSRSLKDGLMPVELRAALATCPTSSACNSFDDGFGVDCCVRLGDVALGSGSDGANLLLAASTLACPT